MKITRALFLPKKGIPMKDLFRVSAVLLCFFLASDVFSAPRIGTEPAGAAVPSFTETEIDFRYDGQVVTGGVLKADGKTILISASDAAIVGLKLEGEGNRVLITGERVTLEDCSFAGAETEVTGKGFFALRCNFDKVSFSAEATDAEAARCVIGGEVVLGGRNQVLYGNRCAAVRADGASNLSVVKNEGESIALQNVSHANLSENVWNEGIVYDDRAGLWGSDLPGVLDEEEHAGADESRLPQNDKTRFEASTVREKVYFGGTFVSLNECAASAAVSSDEEFILPPGVYLNAEPFGFTDRRNFTLAAYGALIRFKNYAVTSVGIIRCDDFAAEGLTTDHMRVANAQGTVVAIDGESFVWKPDEGYGFDLADPAFFSPVGIGHAFHADDRLPYMDCYELHYVKNEDGTFTVSKVSGLSVGDRFTIRGLGGHVFDIADSGNITFRDMTIWSGSAFAFNVWQGAGRVSILRTLVVPGPKPEGAAEERVHSTCDASHFSNVRLGPFVEDSVFTDMTDDGMNVNGHYAVTDGYDSETHTFSIVKSYTVMYGTYASHTASFKKGDTIRVLTHDSKLLAETSAAGPVENGKLTVSDRLELPTTDVVLQNACAQSSGFTVRNTVVERIRSRGLLIKAGDGLVEHCTFRDVRTAGILGQPESIAWPEFGFVSNLTIRNNLFVGTGYADPKIRLFAPIAFCGDGPATADPAYQLHHNLIIEGNLIKDRRNETAIWLSHVTGAVVRGNTVTEPSPSILDEGGLESLPAPLTIDSATDVEISGNTWPERVAAPVEVLEAVRRLRVGR